ncbi:hypothetical protein CEXT_204171 [Caerostris extrusa]|uniref:Uncharacterized protein n=1 Tax=Caerostris extrusa TaxID=172846 RepID=A0AAV4W9V8_CAEEX|nr:hypothetical protein CEXT_204171 [Caerostris extrusa]
MNSPLNDDEENRNNNQVLKSNNQKSTFVSIWADYRFFASVIVHRQKSFLHTTNSPLTDDERKENNNHNQILEFNIQKDMSASFGLVPNVGMSNSHVVHLCIP